MDLMTRPLTRKEVSDMVENDEIPFKVRIDKILALPVRMTNQMMQYLISQTKCHSWFLEIQMGQLCVGIS